MAYRRFPYLVERGLVANRASLRNRILHNGFPPGRLIGPNTRAWTDEELAEYEARCPTGPKSTTLPPRREGMKLRDALTIAKGAAR
jgi:hypothetical protein